MSDDPLADYNIFMMCERLDDRACTQLPAGYHVRQCRPDELAIWRAFPFDTREEARQYEAFMDAYFAATYGAQQNEFFERTLFVCDAHDSPVATCATWLAHGKINTIHWFKTRREFEGRGIGRTLLSIILQRCQPADFPIYLHTQPGSYRAIKLYSDFGFVLLSGGPIGNRTNYLELSLPHLKHFMPASEFEKLKIVATPQSLIDALRDATIAEF